MDAAGLFIDRWYAVLRGGPSPVACLDLHDRQDAEAVREAWAGLGPGERIMIRTSGSAASRSRLARLQSLLETPDAAESFLEFGAGRRVVTLLPADAGPALRGSLELLPADLPGGRALAALLRLASPFNMAQRFGRPEVSVWTRLGRALPAQDLPVLPVDGHVAVQVNSAAPGQALTVRALDRRGDARVSLQIGVSPASAVSVQRGAEALAFLREAGLEQHASLFASGEREGCPWLASDAAPATSPALEGAFGPAHTHFLLGLLEHRTAGAPLPETAVFVDSWRHLASLRRDQDPEWHDDYSALARTLERSAAGAPLAAGPAHGDFTPGNVRVEGPLVFASEWGSFARQAPLLYDLLHFITATAGPKGVPKGGEHLTAEGQSVAVWEGLRRVLLGPARDLVAASQLSDHSLALHLGLTVLIDGTSAEMRARLGPASDRHLEPQRSILHQLARRCREVLDGERRGPWRRDDEHREAA